MSVFNVFFQHYPVAQLDQLSHLPTKTGDSRYKDVGVMCRTSRNCSKTTEKFQRLLYKTVESKYLGTYKLLDHKVCVDGSQPQTVNSLRAVVYQVSVFTRAFFLERDVSARSPFYCL